MVFEKFGSIATIKKGKKTLRQTHDFQSGYMPYVDIEVFETGKIKTFTDGEKCLPCKNGDILIVCDGSRSGLVAKAIDGYVGSTLAIIAADGMPPRIVEIE
jgi:type I restriction enzyme S subunit